YAERPWRVAPGSKAKRPRTGPGALGCCLLLRLGRLAQALPEEGVGQRAHVRGLGVVGRAAMSALDVLEVGHVLAGIDHLRRHLARMARVDAVIAGGGEEDHRRVLPG